MTGKLVAFGLFGFPLIFGAALYYFQYYYYYDDVTDITSITVQERVIEVENYVGIDATSSNLKMRGCFLVSPADFQGLDMTDAATPLTPPPWFDCYNAERITLDLQAGAAVAYLAKMADKEGMDLMVAVYPDGRAFRWRQLNDTYQE
ncbi:MAG: DUF6446 family protein [Rhodobacteraceae bacterium]|nr:DUF6446 family protein [Paracoccaceae bacterium]